MTAQNTNDPPMTVAIAGNSAKTSHAKSGASGVSKTLNSAVCPADIRFAPSASAAAMPVGLQLVGNYFDEATLLHAAHALQQATDFHTRVPPGY